MPDEQPQETARLIKAILERLLPYRVAKHNSCLSTNLTTKVSATMLEADGWSLKRDSDFQSMISFLAERSGFTLAVYCSGIDAPLKLTTVKDLTRLGINNQIYPVFVQGEASPMSFTHAVTEGRVAFTTPENLADTKQIIDQLAPFMTAVADRVDDHNNISGWARLRPFGRATITAVHDGEHLGSAVADEYREDLASMGDGNYGFKIALTRQIDRSDILNEVKLEARYQDFFIGTIRYWHLL